MASGIIEKLYERARLAGDAPALMDDRRTLSAAELLRAVAGVRARLRAIGAAPGSRVAICSDNAIEAVVAMLGILDAGCAFVPLSPRDPVSRLERFCERAKPVALFSSKQKKLDVGAQHLPLEDVLQLAEGPLPRPEGSDHPDAGLAYIIFTSGSTGEPKGVCISNGAFYHAADAAARAMGFDASTRSLVILPLHFDGSFSSVFPVLLAGGSVYVPRGPICPPSTFLRLLRDESLTHTTLTPTYLRALVDDAAWSSAHASSWRTLALGGEDPPTDHLRRLRAELPGLEFFNRYGPTEATMAVSTLRISDEMLASGAKIPIGFPHPGVEFVVQENGELYIGGAQLMLGYLDDPGATDAVLGALLNDGRKLLRTGDVVSIDAEGRYVFVERIDDVVKRNGARISLGEIESALARVDGVRAAACVKVKAGVAVHIVAFVKSSDDALSEQSVRRQLLRELPTSMNPDRIRFLPDLPTASGGKVDRAALARLASEALASNP